MASAVALLWACLPINISTTLITVQRMTGLAAFFSLGGIYGYLLCLKLYSSFSFFRAFILQFSILGMATLLSIFSKENGALTPIYVFIIEILLLSSKNYREPFWRMRVAVLGALLIVLVFYLLSSVSDFSAISDKRGYSVFDRIKTQVVILWIYLKNMFIPLPTSFSPFHDDIKIVKNSDLVYLSILAWFLILVASFYVRAKNKFIIFGLCWYFTGHLIESTVVMLELYFEHRNYLSSFGFCLALVASIEQLGRAFSKTLYGAFALYTMLIMVISSATVSMWGQPAKAAEIWSASAPGSSRAAIHLATIDIESAGGSATDAHLKVLKMARQDIGIDRLDRTIAACSDCIDVHMQAILLACALRQPNELRKRLEVVTSEAAKGKAAEPTVDSLFPLTEMASKKACPGITLSNLSGLIHNLIYNPKLSDGKYQAKMRYQLAEIAYHQRDATEARKQLKLAEQNKPDALPVLQFQYFLAVSDKNWNEAEQVVLRRVEMITEGGPITKKVLSAMLNEVIEKRGKEADES